MEVSSISSGAMLAQMLVSANPVQNAAAVPVGAADPEYSLRMKEQPGSARAEKPAEAQASPSAEAPPSNGPSATMVAQNAQSPDSSNAQEVTPVREERLLDYLNEMEDAPGTMEPSKLLDSVTGSFMGVMEKAQGILSAKPSSAAGEGAPLEGGRTGEIDQMLDRYVSVSWAVFSASLATNSVAAASSSVNTLVKQQ